MDAGLAGRPNVNKGVSRPGKNSPQWVEAKREGVPDEHWARKHSGEQWAFITAKAVTV